MTPGRPRLLQARHLMAGLVPGLLSAVVLLAAVAASVGGSDFFSPLVAAVILLVVVVVTTATFVQQLRTVDGEPPTELLGQLALVRVVLVMATALLLLGPGALRRTDQPVDPAAAVPVVIAMTLLVGAIVLEPIFARILAARITFVAGLPGVQPVAPMPRLERPILVSNLGAISLGIVAVLGGLSATPWALWLWGAIALFALAPGGLLVLAGRQRLAQGRRLEFTIGSAVAAYAPEFLVYTSRPDDASYQVAMWLPYLQRSGRRFIIVTRDTVPARALAAQTDVPIVVRRRIADLDDVVPPSLRAAFYVNASSGNGAFIRYSQLTHVYLGHGDSDKPPSYNPTHAMYDKIFAAGAAATRRYAAHGVNIPADKFEVVGRPQVEDVAPAGGPIADVQQPTVLYAPTWRGHVEETLLYSLPVGERIVAALLERGANVIFRPHPFSYSFPEDAATIARIQRLLADDAQHSERQHLWGAAAETDRGIRECINGSDAMVSDVSSVVSDYLFSDKPFAMVAVPSAPEAFVEEYPIAQAAYVIDGGLENLSDRLDAMLTTDPARERREAIRVDYLGDFPAEHYADGFIDAVRRVSDRQLDTDLEEVPPEADEPAGASNARDLSAIRREVSAVGGVVLVTGAALLSLVAVQLRWPLLVAALFAAVSMALIVIVHRRSLRRAVHRLRLVGSFDLARVVLVLAAGLGWSAAPHLLGQSGSGQVGSGQVGWIVAAVLLQVVAIAGERIVELGWGRLGLEVAGLPELGAGVREPYQRGLVPLTQWAVIVLGWMLAVLGGPSIVWFIAALLQFLLFADALARSVVRVHRVVAAEERLRPALLARAPEFAIYFSSTIGAAYQIGMWLPYLKRIERPFIIVVRSVPMLRAVAPLTDVPVIYRPTLRSLEDVIVPSLRAAFYVNNAVRNTHFVERRELTHVWLNHGDSEKPACYNPVHAIYDLIFAAGQAGIDRYARHGVEIPREKFEIVGRPQVEVIEQASGPIAQVEQPTVLYAPTWRGPYADSAVYSLPQGDRIVAALLARGVRVVFRSHPFNYRFPESRAMIEAIGGQLAADKARTGRAHLWGSAAEEIMTVEDCFNASDAMISDVSAVVSDYLQSAKPFSIVAVGRTTDELLTEAPAAQAAYLLQQDLSNLDTVLDDLLRADPLATERERTRVYYLGNFSAEHYADGFIRAARAVIEQQTPADA